MMSRDLFIHKLKAMAISLAVFACFACLLLLLNWGKLYPDFLFPLDGGIKGLQLVLAVDLVLGPVMAFVIYNHQKSRREQTIDIALVVLIQLSAMLWGSYQVWSQRPIAVVYGDGRFVSITAGDIKSQEKTADDLKPYSDRQPPFVYRREPASMEEQARLVLMQVQSAIPAEAQVWLFEGYGPNRSRIFADSDRVRAHLESSGGDEWAEWKTAHASALEGFRYALFEGRYANAVLIFDKEGAYVDYIRLPGRLPRIEEPAAGGGVSQ